MGHTYFLCCELYFKCYRSALPCGWAFILHEGVVITSFRCTMADLFQPATKPGFHRFELLRAVWEVPLYYQDLQPIGTGAYGSVMLVLRAGWIVQGEVLFVCQ